jgi:uncharacterized membrane protein
MRAQHPDIALLRDSDFAKLRDLGLLFLSPILGVAMGATSGALAEALSDLGINNAFMKDLAKSSNRATTPFLLSSRT